MFLKLPLLISLILSFSFYAQAINLQQTRRSNSLTFEKLDDARTYNGYVKNDYNWILTLGASYVDAPLVIKNASNSDQIQELIKYIQGLHLGGGYYFNPWFMVGFETAFNSLEDNNGDTYSGFSDPQIRARFRFYNEERLAFAIAPFINLNLDQSGFEISNAIASSSMNGVRISPLSDESLGLGFNLIGEYLLRSVQIVGNIGYQHANKAIDRNSLGEVQADYRQLLLTGFGAYVPINRVWGLNFEFLRQWTFELFNNDQERNEFFMGAAGAINPRLHAYAGLGLGNLMSENDGNDFRVSAGLKYIGYHKSEPRKPLRALVSTSSDRIKSINDSGVSDSGLEPKTNINNIPSDISANRNCMSFIFGNTNFAVIRFPNNSSRISDNQGVIKKMVTHLLKYQSDIESIEINGHTSTKADESYNLKLSQRRAENTEKYFKTLGLNTNYVIKSLGEKDLLQSEDEAIEAVESLNRRVEIKVNLKESFNGCI